MDVTSTVLAGLSTATSAAIAATDTVLAALGKLQAQINAKAPTASPTFTGTATTPALTVSGGALELGGTSGTATAAYVDFHSSGYANDYDARVIASGGTSSNAQASLSVYATSVSFSSGITATGAGISASTGVNRWLNILSNGSSRWNIGSNAASENSTTLATSAAQTAAGTDLAFTSTAGVSVGMLVKGTSIPSGATVASIVANSSVTLSVATTAIVASGASIFFYANTGSDLSFNRYNDDGTLLQTSTLSISRATGKATFNGQLWAGQGLGTGAGIGASVAGAAQGAYLGWNTTGGTGEMDFINSRGGGAGGFNFYNITTSTTSTMTLLASINSAGVFNTARVFAATTGSSINDTNVQMQIDTKATGQAYFGANKAGAYGLLLGYNGSFGQIRQVTTDPLQILVNSTTLAAQFNSDTSVTFAGVATFTQPLDGGTF